MSVRQWLNVGQATRWQLLMLLGMLVMAPANADETQKPWEKDPAPIVIEDRLRLEMGIWNTSIKSILRVDPTATQSGTTLDGEKDLGLGAKKTIPDFELTLFPGKNHLIRLSTFTSRRTGQATLTKTINYDKDVYNINDNVTSTMDMNMVGLTYGYRIFRARRYELDADLRIQVAKFETNLQGPTNYNRKADSIVLPLPMLGLEGRLELYKKLNVIGRYQWLGATVTDTHGVITDWRVGFLWQQSQHLGIALETRSFNINVQSLATSSHPGVLDLRHSGWQLGFRGSL